MIKHSILAAKVLDLIDLTDPDWLKLPAWDGETDTDGKGVLTVQITNTAQPNPGLDDWEYDVSILGATFTSDDPDRKRIENAFFDAIQRVLSLTPGDFAGIDASDIVCGVLPVSRAAHTPADDQNQFTIDFKIVSTNN